MLTILAGSWSVGTNTLDHGPNLMKLFFRNSSTRKFVVAARALATYLVPGCVGRGVKLGSESSSGAAGAGAGRRTLRSQPGPSPNAPRDQIRRKGPCCDKSGPCEYFWQNAF